MGKGDRKSKKGKIWRGSYGKRRPRLSKGFTVIKKEKKSKSKSKKS